MRRTSERDETAVFEEGTSIAREVLEEVRPVVAGVLISAPGGDVERAIAVLQE